MLIFLLFIFWVYWVNTFHTNFPDEFDNIVGGWYINRGILPYIGFFSHHNPGSYYIASIITFFTKQSFVAFRTVWAVILYLSAIGSYFILNKKLGNKTTNFYLIYIFLLGISATYYWGHMILSETIVGYMFIPSFALVFLKVMERSKITLKDITLISIATSVALLTSFTFIFAICIFLLLTLYCFIRRNGWNRNIILALVILGLPYIVFLIYLVITGSLSEYYFQAITYNKEYYIYNFPTVAGQVSKHPLRYFISIFYTASMQFYTLFNQVRNFNFSYPVTITLLLSNLTLIVYLLTKKKLLMAAFLYLIIVYLNARSDALNSAETDFHSTVYIMFSLFSLVFVLWSLVKEINNRITHIQRLLYSFLFSILGIYVLFTSLFFIRSFSDKVYSKFMGQAPAIYDAPVVAPIINKIVSKDEYFWIGPFEFQELLYINGKLPSKYHWFLPANERSEKIRSEITTDLIKNKPKLVVFKEDYTAFSTLPKDFNYPIVNILREHFFRLEDLEKEGKKYKARITNLHNFDIEQNFYFDKSRKEEIIKLLIQENIIEPV